MLRALLLSGPLVYVVWQRIKSQATRVGHGLAYSTAPGHVAHVGRGTRPRRSGQRIDMRLYVMFWADSLQTLGLLVMYRMPATDSL